MKRLAALKAQHNIERFVIIQRLKCGSFKLNKDDDNAAHAWDDCTLLREGIIYLIAWAIVCYRLAGPSTTSVLVISNSSHAIPFINRQLLGNSWQKNTML